MSTSRDLDCAAKRAFDVTLSLALCIGFAPIAAAIAIAIRIDDGGPPLFEQSRIGLDGRSFRMFKFRTMIENADDYLDNSGTPTRHRVTRVGVILRRSSLDELPQIVNVIRGDMALVGPRPMLSEHLSRLTARDRKRFEVRPGLTGLAQISGRNSLSWSERLNLDVRYVEDWNPALDWSIMLRTLRLLMAPPKMALDRNPAEVMDLDVRG